MSSCVPPRFATMRNPSLSSTTSSNSEKRGDGRVTNWRGSLRTRSYTGLVMAKTRSQSSRPHPHNKWMKELAGRLSSPIASLISRAATSFRATRSSRKPTMRPYGFPDAPGGARRDAAGGRDSIRGEGIALGTATAAFGLALGRSRDRHGSVSRPAGSRRQGGHASPQVRKLTFLGGTEKET
jgi:hypothetical protein